MSVDTATLSEFNEKDVLITFTNKDGEVESDVEGNVAGASEVGIAFKRKGRRDLELIEPSAVESLVIAPKKPTLMKQRKTLPVTAERVRAHLATAHGLNLSWLNASTNEEAEEYHNGLDHSDLIHNHNKVEGEAEEVEETPEAE